MVIDYIIYKDYGVIAEYNTFSQHLEDVSREYPDSRVRDLVEAAAWRSTYICQF